MDTEHLFLDHTMYPIFLENIIYETGFATFQFLSYVFVNPIYKGSNLSIVHTGIGQGRSFTILSLISVSQVMELGIHLLRCVIMVQSLLARL